MKLHNKVIVITGSTRGIGRAIAEACAGAGATVVVSSRNQDIVLKTIVDFQKKGWKVSGMPVDVSREKDIKALFKHALDNWGKIDVWVNNAGLSGGYQFLDQMNPEEIKDIINVNLTGMLLASRIILKYFKDNSGILINMSGKGGRGDASPYLTTYGATKAAVISLTKSLAEEYKDYPVSIHAVLPGMVETDFYNEVKTSPELVENMKNIPLILKAIGVPKEKVGELFVGIAAQESGKVTGKTYSLFKGIRLIKGIGTMIWYRATGRIK